MFCRCLICICIAPVANDKDVESEGYLVIICKNCSMLSILPSGTRGKTEPHQKVIKDRKVQDGLTIVPCCGRLLKTKDMSALLSEADRRVFSS